MRKEFKKLKKFAILYCEHTEGNFCNTIKCFSNQGRRFNILQKASALWDVLEGVELQEDDVNFCEGKE